MGLPEDDDATSCVDEGDVEVFASQCVYGTPVPKAIGTSDQAAEQCPKLSASDVSFALSDLQDLEDDDFLHLKFGVKHDDHSDDPMLAGVRSEEHVESKDLLALTPRPPAQIENLQTSRLQSMRT